jgi:methylmalonyl-CoA mutase
VGVNKYPDTAAQSRRSRWPDPSTFAAQRVAEWQELRLSTSFAASESRLQKLHQAGQSTPEDLFAAGVDAALHGATLGELTQFLRRDEGEKPRVEAIALQRDAESFEELHRTVLAWREQRQRDPQVFLANIGPVAEYMPRLDFTRFLLQAGGLAVTGEGWFPDADSALQAARGAGAPVVAIVAEDARYPEVVPILATALKQEPEPPLVIVAGPAGDNAELFLQAGVDGFIQPHNDGLAFLRDLTRRIGVTS